MSEKLKTVKEIIDYSEYDHIYGTIDPRELRAEAVKWVKALEKTNISSNEDKSIWIKHFFNISEEDLK